MAADRSFAREGYDGELAGSILLEDGEDMGQSCTDLGGGRLPTCGQLGSLSSLGQKAPNARIQGDQRTHSADVLKRAPDRTPSPVYQWNHVAKVSIGGDHNLLQPTPGDGRETVTKNGHAAPGSIGGGEDPESALAPGSTGSEANQFGQMPNFFTNPYWGGGYNAQPLQGTMANSQLGPQGFPLEYMQMMMAMQAMQQAQGSAAAFVGKGQSSPSASSSAVPKGGSMGKGQSASNHEATTSSPVGSNATNAGRAGKGGFSVHTSEEQGKRSKNRDGGERKKRGGTGNNGIAGDRVSEAAGHQKGGKGGKFSDSRPSSNPSVQEQKAREKHVQATLGELTRQIMDVVQDQHGSRMIQQRLEVAGEEEKQHAFKAVLQNMHQLTVHEFGNYVIQKFFEYGSAEQRRILAEQLVGQVLTLSHQMYGCRVVQKALDTVPIEQQVLLVGELKRHVLECTEDQHGNHVIQKCIERLPTDKIQFIVDAFDGQIIRMAVNCYGCRVIQRIIEYCSSQQISTLIDEVLRHCMDLATDQYGNYVVQHVMEHSSRKGDRDAILQIMRKNINFLSCHKFASNVVEKALQCSTSEEKALIISAIVGDPGDAHPPLLNMMRDRFGNFVVQRIIGLAQGPEREALLSKLREQLPQLKKSSTYGKHIISALERAQAQTASA